MPLCPDFIFGFTTQNCIRSQLWTKFCQWHHLKYPTITDFCIQNQPQLSQKSFLVYMLCTIAFGSFCLIQVDTRTIWFEAILTELCCDYWFLSAN
jgi:hypothetical protein